MTTNSGNSRKRTSITFLIDRLGSTPGGAERVTLNIARALSDRGYPTSIITYESPKQDLPVDINYQGVEVVNCRPHYGRGRRPLLSEWVAKRYPTRTFLHAISYFHTLARRTRHVRRVMRRINPDGIVIGVLPPTFAVARYACLLSRRTAALTIHNVPERDLNDPNRWSKNLIERRGYGKAVRNVEVVIALLDEFRPTLERYGPKKVSIIPNCVIPAPGTGQARNCRKDGSLDVNQSSNPSELEESSKPSTKVVFVGRLAEVKGVDVLLRAWAMMEHELDADLLIYGTGPQGRSLKALRNELGLKRAVFKGYWSDPWSDIPKDSIVVLPSIHEGFGMACLEALTHGHPVIAYASCSGHNTLVVDQHNGILVKVDNMNCKSDRAVSLVKPITDLVRNSDQRRFLSDSAPASISAYSEERVAKQWMNLIETFS